MATTSRTSYHNSAPAPIPGQSPTMTPGGQTGFDYRYEFSETRKVLEEFFKAENEFPEASTDQNRTSYTDSIHTGNQFPRSMAGHVSQVPQDVDLDYSLTRLEVKSLQIDFGNNHLHRNDLLYELNIKFENG